MVVVYRCCHCYLLLGGGYLSRNLVKEIRPAIDVQSTVGCMVQSSQHTSQQWSAHIFYNKKENVHDLAVIGRMKITEL